MNLEKRGIRLGGLQHRCVFCNMEEEDLTHMLFKCKFYMAVWANCYKWLGREYNGSAIKIPVCIFSNTIVIGWESDPLQYGVQWLGPYGAIETVIFAEEREDFNEVIELYRYKAWSWISTRWKKASFSYYEWYANPSYCLKMIH